MAGTVTWTSSNASIASVNSTSGLITAVAVGTTTLTATSTVDATKSGSIAVTVQALPPATALAGKLHETVLGECPDVVGELAVVKPEVRVGKVVQSGVQRPAS